MKKLKWKLEVTIEVAELWVEDGFEASPEYIKEFIEDELLPWAYAHEKKVTVKTISAPLKEKIKELQG